MLHLHLARLGHLHGFVELPLPGALATIVLGPLDHLLLHAHGPRPVGAPALGPAQRAQPAPLNKRVEPRQRL